VQVWIWIIRGSVYSVNPTVMYVLIDRPRVRVRIRTRLSNPRINEASDCRPIIVRLSSENGLIVQCLV